MRKITRKLTNTILIGATGLALTVTAALGAWGTGSTGAPAPAVATFTLVPNQTSLLMTNNIEVVGVSVITPSGSGILSFYDNWTTNMAGFGTNYIVASNLVSRVSYSTNWVTSYVGSNGYTNYYTNSGLWTLTTTNTLPQTNSLPSQGTFGVISGTIMTYNNTMMFSQGIVGFCSTNCTLTLYYLPNK